LQGELFRELQDVMALHEIPIQKVPLERIDRFTRKNHQGVLAFMSAVTYQKIEDIVPLLYEQGKNPFIVVLDGITDVRNFGAIARTCEVAGVDAIVIPARGSVRVSADAIKTSAGALHSIPVCREQNLKDAVQFLKDSGIKVVAATEQAAENYTTSSYTDPVAILMGAEDVGISDELLKISDELVRLPIFGTIESLNVSVAAGVMLYEVIRQRSES